MLSFQLAEWVKCIGHVVIDLLELPNIVVSSSLSLRIPSQLAPPSHHFFEESQDNYFSNFQDMYFSLHVLRVFPSSDLPYSKWLLSTQDALIYLASWGVNHRSSWESSPQPLPKVGWGCETHDVTSSNTFDKSTYVVM